MFVFIRTQSIAIALLLLACGMPQAWGQRYLSEFVGSTTLKSSTVTSQLSTNLEFETLDNRRLQGGFSLRNASTTNNDLFSVAGTLAQSGNCNVQVQNATTSGGLNLVEVPFDDTSFALIGNANANIASNRLLSIGKYRGTTAVMRPVADPVLVASPIMVIAVNSQVTGERSTHQFEVKDMFDSLAVTGRVSQTGILNGFNLSLSANSRWTYVVGENGSRFLAMRVKSITDGTSNLVGFSGTYSIFDASGKLLDSGAISGAVSALD